MRLKSIETQKKEFVPKKISKTKPSLAVSKIPNANKYEFIRGF